MVRSLPISESSRDWNFGVDVTEQRELERAILFDKEEHSLTGIGQHLHDGVCQQLVGICYLSELIMRELQGTPQKTQSIAKKILGEARHSLGVTRKMAHGLMAACEELFSLEEELRSLAKQIEKIFEISCHLDIRSGIEPSDPERTIQSPRIPVQSESLPQGVWFQRSRWWALQFENYFN